MKEIPSDKIRRIRVWEHGDQTSILNGLNDEKHNVSLIDLASNDYLGLSKNPRLIHAATMAMNSDGVGSGGSHLVTGTRPIHQELESALCKWLGRESVLLFPSGFQANLAAIISLANRRTLILADKLIHHSLLVGAKASGAQLKRFPHNDLNELEELLKAAKTESKLVITESLFSMEGTSPLLDKIRRLCEKYGANLFVDEAHALGVMGPQGKGLCYGLSKPLDIISGTFGKAFGSGGAFLASNQPLGEYLLQTSGAYRYTTALAPPLAAATLEALKLISSNPDWGEQLRQEANRWRKRITSEGWYIPPGLGPILSIVIGSAKQSLYYQSKLEHNGLLSVAIRPPTVPEGTSRLRIVVRKGLPENTLEKLISCLGTK